MRHRLVRNLSQGTALPGVNAVLEKVVLLAGVPEELIIMNRKVSGSEDTTFLMSRMQPMVGETTFFYVGSLTFGSHHNPRFDIHVDMMRRGVKWLWEFASLVVKGED